MSGTSGWARQRSQRDGEANSWRTHFVTHSRNLFENLLFILGGAFKTCYKSVMPKIDIAAVSGRKGSGYPSPFDKPCAERVRQRLGNAGAHSDFGVNLMQLPPGSWSSQRHWHSDEDEFVYVLDGELTLIEDGGETLLRSGECAAFPKRSGNRHHLINRSNALAVYLEVGSRSSADITTCSDVDMMSCAADGQFVHKDGTPYS